MMFLGLCEDCKRIRRCGLPSDFSETWLTDHVSVIYRCKACYAARRAEKNGEIIQIEEVRWYLIKMREVVPLLSTVAAIVMICLEIAWHT